MSFGSFDTSPVSRSPSNTVPAPNSAMDPQYDGRLPYLPPTLPGRTPSPGPSRGEMVYGGYTSRPGFPVRGHDYNDIPHYPAARRGDQVPRYSRTPSPEYFPPPPVPDAWGRDASWRPSARDVRWDPGMSPPPGPSYLPGWNRPVSPAPPPEWTHRRSEEPARDDRLFEPSAAWRQTHRDPESRPEISVPNSASPIRTSEERRWPEPIADRSYGRPGLRHDLYPEPDDLRHPSTSYSPRDSYPVPLPFRAHPEDQHPRGGSSYRPPSRGTPRPSALGNYKLQQRQASHSQSWRATHYDPTNSPRSWNRENSTSAGGFRTDSISSPTSGRKPLHDGRGRNIRSEKIKHRLPQARSSQNSPRQEVGSSAVRSGRRTSSGSSRSDIASSDNDSDVASSRSSSRSSQSSRSQFPSRTKPELDGAVRNRRASSREKKLDQKADLIQKGMLRPSTSQAQLSSGSVREGRRNGPLVPQAEAMKQAAHRKPSKTEDYQAMFGQQPQRSQPSAKEPSHREDQLRSSSLTPLPQDEDLACNETNIKLEAGGPALDISRSSHRTMPTTTGQQQMKDSSEGVLDTSESSNLNTSGEVPSSKSFRDPVALLESASDESLSSGNVTHQMPDTITSAPLTLEGSPSIHGTAPEARASMSVDRSSTTLSRDAILTSESAARGAGTTGMADDNKPDTTNLHPPPTHGKPSPPQATGRDNAHAYQTHLRMDAKSMTEALRTTITARRKHDLQERSQRVNPILIANLSIIELPYEMPSTSPETLIGEVLDKVCSPAKMDVHRDIRLMLATRFAERNAVLSEKAQKLREEYVTLHERWLANCAQLDSEFKAGVVVEENTATTGRTTRRSAATISDAVRSDLEMEQIIASLGNEDSIDPNHLSVRNIAVVPDMICAAQGQVGYLFDDTNGLVDDPESFYDSRSGFYDWAPGEEEIFFEKYAEYPKQFGYIASFLPHKTTAQCVLYYYVHKKKLIDFRSAANAGSGKRRKGPRKSGKQKSNTLLADIQEHDKDKPGPRTRRRRGVLAAAVDNVKSNSRRSTAQPEGTPDLESRPKRRRVNVTARALAAKELEAEDNASVDGESGREPAKKPARRARKPKEPKEPKAVQSESPALSPVPETKFIDVNDTLGRRRLPAATSYWSITDKDEFLRLLARHGKNFKRIAASMPNKTTIQVSNYYKSHLIDLDLEKVAQAAQSRSPSVDPLPRDPFVNGTHFVTPSSAGPGAPSGSGEASLAGSVVESGSKTPERQTPPWNDAASTSNGFQAVQLEKKSSKERQIWFREEFPPSSHAPHPQKGFMSVLHPSSFHAESPGPARISLHPPSGPYPPPPMNPVHPSPFAPSSFQFSAYKPPSYDAVPQQSQLQASPAPSAEQKGNRVEWLKDVPSPEPSTSADTSSMSYIRQVFTDLYSKKP